MQSEGLQIGRYNAYREKLSAGAPLLKVKLIEKVGRGGKVKIRFENGPHPGLEEYVRTRNLIVPWGKRKSLVRDEERRRALDDHHRARRRDPAVANAIATVVASSGEPSAWCEPDGLGMPEEELERIAARAGLDKETVDLHHLAFRDRQGDVQLPIEAAEALARAFASAEPKTVLMFIEDEEERYRSGGYAPGERWMHDRWREQQPGFALARQWAGFEHEVEQLQKEIGRLRSLVSIAASDLRSAGEERKARRLMRGLEGR